MVDGSHAIRLGLRLCPRTHATVDEVVVAVGDGLLDDPIRPIMRVVFLARGVLQEWSWLFTRHVEPPRNVCLFNHIDDSVQTRHEREAR